MKSQRLIRRRCAAYTLVELIGVVSLLFLAAGAGTQLDLVDLVESEVVLKQNEIELDAKSLIEYISTKDAEFSLDMASLKSDDDFKSASEKVKESGHAAVKWLTETARGDERMRKFAEELLPDALKAQRKHRFLLQVACRSLGESRNRDAVPALQTLTMHDDHFVAKHARTAIAMIESPATKTERDALPENVSKLIPTDFRIALDYPGTPQSNIAGIGNLVGSENWNRMIQDFASSPGNVEIGRATVLVDERSLIRLILVEGHFDQSGVIELASLMDAKTLLKTDEDWVGQLERIPGAAIALSQDRYVVVQLNSDEVTPDELLRLARALKLPQ